MIWRQGRKQMTRHRHLQGHAHWHVRAAACVLAGLMWLPGSLWADESAGRPVGAAANTSRAASPGASPGKLLDALPDNARLEQQRNLDVLRHDLQRAREAAAGERARSQELDARLRAMEQRVQTMMQTLKAQDRHYKALSEQVPAAAAHNGS